MYIASHSQKKKSALSGNIPHIRLEDTSEKGNALFEIREIDIHTRRRHTQLFLPHRKDYYFFFLVKSGHNRHWIDFISYDVKPGNLYFTLPHQVHLKERNAPVEGTLLAFTEEFLLMQDYENLRTLPILQNIEQAHELLLDAGDRDFIESLFTRMLEEHAQEKDWKKSMLQSYLKILLVYLSRLYTQLHHTPTDAAGPSGAVGPSTLSNSNSQHHSQNLVKRLRELVNDQYHTLHQVSDYARILHVSPGHLNDQVKMTTGITATALIQERILLEAKRMLFHTDMNIKEIAYGLGFGDAAYFNRFFKRLSAQTPSAFRDANRRLPSAP